MLATGELEDLLDEIVADDAAGFGAELFGQAKSLVKPSRRFAIAAFAVGPLDEDDDPWRIQPRGQAAGGAHDLFRQRVGPDAHQQTFAARPGAFDGVLLEIVDHLVVDAVGRPPQRQLA